MRKNNNKFIEFRNRDIVKLFDVLGFKVRLVGNPEFPNFILDDEYKLPILVDGNRINIGNKFGNSKYDDLIVEFGKGKIDFDNIDTGLGTRLINILYKSEKLPVFKIRFSNGLYLHDFKYVGKDKPKYPLFALIDPKIIYTEEHAKETLDKLVKEGYKGLSLDTPLFDGLEKA